MRAASLSLAPLTAGRAAVIAALAAVLVYANAPRNRWALDDVAVIWDNPAAHSVSAAWEARFSTYWPGGRGHHAGLYRPVAIMSYAVDWSLSGGEPRWFHVHNVLLHALVSGLVVLVAAAWLPAAGALAAGLVFAVHPVHVEAVANVVGRAELLAALGLLVALLAFRRYRSAAGRREGVAWGGVMLLSVLLALLSKEHAAVAVAILALDAWLVRGPGRRPVAGPLLAVAALTVVWLVIWHAVAGPYVAVTVAPALRDSAPGERLATMLPVYLDVLRLLTWPLRLAYDYNPQVIPRRAAFTALAALGLLAMGAIVALGLLSRRRAPAVAFGIFAGLAAYAPTSNLVFASGTVLAERALYLFALAPALAAGWVLAQAVGTRWQRATVIGAGALLLVYSVRTYTRTPFWSDSRTVLVESVVAYPESYRTRMELGRQFELVGDSLRALAEYRVAGALFERDLDVAAATARLALAVGLETTALEEARRGWELEPGHAAVAEQLVEALLAVGMSDSALAVAREAVERRPWSARAAEGYLRLLERLAAREWQRHVARARLLWLQGQSVAANEALGAAGAVLERAESLDGVCWELDAVTPVAQALRPEFLERALELAARAGEPCGG